MGTTLSSSSHFVAFELLQLRRQVTVMMVGCISIFFDAYALLEDLLFGPSLLDIAFYSITFRLSFRLFLSDLPSGTECMMEYRVGHHLRSVLLAVWNTFGFAALVFPRNNSERLASALFFAGLNSTF